MSFNTKYKKIVINVFISVSQPFKWLIQMIFLKSFWVCKHKTEAIYT
jgi:hypothetical protein